jgi:hypothetical protein
MATVTMGEVAWRVEAFAPAAARVAAGEKAVKLKARQGFNAYRWRVKRPVGGDLLLESRPERGKCEAEIVACVRCGDVDLVAGRTCCPACLSAMGVAMRRARASGGPK